MRKTFAKIKSTKCRIIDGLHTVPKHTPCVMQTKFSEFVMVFGCVSCEVDVMPPHFFREGLWLISDAYVVKPWITRVDNGRPYVW